MYVQLSANQEFSLEDKLRNLWLANRGVHFYAKIVRVQELWRLVAFLAHT